MDGEGGIVSYDDQSGVLLFDQLKQQFHDRLGVFRVEIARGFIGEEDIGLIDDGAGDGNALLFAAG